jgi:hypothetical protein
MRTCVSRALIGAAAGLLCAASASATDYTITSTGLAAGGLSGDIHYTPGIEGGTQVTAGVGPIVMTGYATNDPTKKSVSFTTYCADIFDWLGNGTFSSNAYSSLSSSSQAHPYSVTQLSTVTTFLTNVTASGLLTSSDNKAAAQLGIWEILNESPSNSYNLNTGLFYATGGNLGNAITTANTWLGNLSTTWKAPAAGYTMNLLDPGKGNQPQIFLSTAAVPEPASWAMMVGGFGVLGSVMRQQRRRTATVAA